MKSTRFMAICGMMIYCSAAAAYPQARVTIEVVDEKGAPVPAAQVGMAMYRGNESGGGRGMTDANGLWTCEGRTDGLIGGGVRKDGYYRTEYRFILDDHVPKGVTVGRRYPDVTHRVVIRPKLKPVPMYAYCFSGAIPVEGEEIGIDLLKADWVAPLGKGEVADIMVKIVSAPDSGPRTLGDLSWRFPGEGNGMLRVPPEDCHANSDFRMPRYAPSDGYLVEWKASRKRVDGKIVDETYPEGPRLGAVPYFFRIRTQRDKNGRITRALYGRIDWQDYSIGWSTVKRDATARVFFTYHVNPDGTRNMEFDPGRNLFTDPPWDRHNFPRRP